MNKHFLFIGVLLMVAAATFHWIMRDNTPPPAIVSAYTLEQKKPLDEITSAQPVKSKKNKTNSTLIEDTQTQSRHELPQELTQQFALLSKSYANDVAFPSYSTPLLSNDINYLEPNHFSVVDIPILDGSHTASLSLKKYRFDYPEPIVVTLNSDLGIDHIEYELFDPNTREPLLSRYSQELITEFTPKKEWPQEVRIKATVSFIDGIDILTTDIQFSNPVAYVNSLDAPYSVGSDMILPLNLEVKEAGNYRIRANLYHVDGKPIASLNNKKEITQGKVVFELKAHQSVLKNQQGDLELRNITIERMSDFPGEKTRYGTSKDAVLSVLNFDISSLSDEPYQMSEQEKKRLEFLNDIAQQ
uniref:Uncharacterized protein n=1 Tax=Aliivibrio wodanis TaxID=80852 RepID=A0A5Q4ZW77_9GAMM|nr:hypothetical protein AW0309160_02329 [Aliivibrio wodanis]